MVVVSAAHISVSARLPNFPLRQLGLTKSGSGFRATETAKSANLIDQHPMFTARFQASLSTAPKCMKRDFWQAIEPHRKEARSSTHRGIANHVVIPPSAGAHPSG